jgi:hypothetical protein
MAKQTKAHIAQRKTLLAVGEGKADAAFLKYLREIYCSSGKGLKVTVRNANGRGPGNVIGTAIGALRISTYDKKLCLLDTDLVWMSKNTKDAKRKKIQLIGSTPCLEGMLLLVLGKTVPITSNDCKRLLMEITGRDMYNSEDYAANFPYDQLQYARTFIKELDKLLHLFEER